MFFCALPPAAFDLSACVRGFDPETNADDAKLLASVIQNGVMCPVIVLDGVRVYDGGRRVRAAQVACDLGHKLLVRYIAGS